MANNITEKLLENQSPVQVNAMLSQLHRRLSTMRVQVGPDGVVSLEDEALRGAVSGFESGVGALLLAELRNYTHDGMIMRHGQVLGPRKFLRTAEGIHILGRSGLKTLGVEPSTPVDRLSLELGALAQATDTPIAVLQETSVLDAISSQLSNQQKVS